MTRTSKPAHKTAPRRASSSSPSSGNRDAATANAANDDLNGFNVQMARGIVNSSLAASQELLKFLEQVQQLNGQTLKEMSAGLREALAQAERATDIQELFSLQADLASRQMARAAQNYGALCARWLDTESHFVEQAQEEAARVSQQMLGNGGATAAQSRVSPIADATPLAMLANAQNAFTAMTGQWVDAVKGAAVQAGLSQH
jgi:hypothetical protein